MSIFENDAEILKRKREVLIIINIIEPDPDYQPTFISDKATLFDLFGHNECEMRERLTLYFKNIVPSLDLTLPLWKLIDAIKIKINTWP